MASVFHSKLVPRVIVIAVLLAILVNLAGAGCTAGLKQQLTETEQSLAATEAALSQAQSDLSAKESELSAAGQALAQVKSQLTETRGAWLSAKRALAGTETELAQTETTLAQTEAELAETKEALSASEASLAQASADLAALQNQLTQTEETLAGTEASLAQARTDLAAVQTQLTQTEGTLADAEAERDSLKLWYRDLRQEVVVRLGWGEDAMNFVTPDDPSVASKVQQVTGGFSSDVNEQWADFKRLYSWVVGNIEYSYDTPTPLLPETGGWLTWQQDYWRMPSETLEDGRGDCEDMSTLLTSMILSYLEGRYPAWCITWTSADSGHAAVAFPVAGGQLTILDPAGNYYTNIWGTLTSKATSTAVNEWLAHWSQENPEYVNSAFSHDFYQSFTSTQEFLDWCSQ